MHFNIKYENTIRYLMVTHNEEKRISHMQKWIYSCVNEQQLNSCRISIGIMFDDSRTQSYLLDFCKIMQGVLIGEPLSVSKSGLLITQR